MELYNKVVGIDIGKFSFVVHGQGKRASSEYDNTSTGIKKFLTDYKVDLKHALCILEATGGYEMKLLYTMCQKGISVHRANTRKVKNFIRSYGNQAKTDQLDAKALALYGYERQQHLALFKPVSKHMLELYELVQRRKSLSKMLVAEKNRRQGPRANIIKSSCDMLIQVLNQQTEEIKREIDRIIASDPVLSKKRKVLMTIPGVGPVVSAELLTMMPELGNMDRRQAASLAGLAPQANDSGKFKGYRRVAPGRNSIKPMLFLAAMAARNSNSQLREFYDKLRARGKLKMVALVAVMRKIVVIANARLKEIT